MEENMLGTKSRSMQAGCAEAAGFRLRSVGKALVLVIAIFGSVVLARGTASASCSSALALANAGEQDERSFESLMFSTNPDPHDAIRAYESGAAATAKARGTSCSDPTVQGHVLLASAELSIIHASLELNAAPDNDRPQCPLEHRDVAKSDVANAWVALHAVTMIQHSTGTTYSRYDKTVANARLVASRLGMALPPLATTGSVEQFATRYAFEGSGECFHNPEP